MGGKKMADPPLYPDFPKDEFNHRYQRARQMMAVEGLDALLVTAPTNYMYFTGHRSEQMLADKIRPYVFLLPLEGDPICFVMPFEEGHVRLVTWIDDVRTYGLMQHQDVFEASFRDLGLANGRIGCELGREQYLRLSYNDFNELKTRLPEASFVDASEIFLQLRVIKSPAEVARCREAAEIVSRSLDHAYSIVKPGMTNQDVARLVRRTIIDEGADKVPFLSVASGYDFSKGKASVPNPRRLEVGDTLTVDTGAELKGYYCDIARTAVIGQASQEQRDMYKFVIDLNHICYEALRAGNLCEDVPLTCFRELERLGRKTQGVGRIGHGVGCDGAEYPSLAVGEKILLEPGMVFACNPNFVTEYGFFNIEDDLVVTETGYDVLPNPPAPRELQVLG